MLKCDDRFARQNRGGPPPEFPLASPSSSIVHHLSGPIGRAPTGTVRNRPPSVDDAPPSDRRFSSPSLSLSLSAVICRGLARTLDSLVRVSRRVRCGRIHPRVALHAEGGRPRIRDESERLARPSTRATLRGGRWDGGRRRQARRDGATRRSASESTLPHAGPRRRLWCRPAAWAWIRTVSRTVELSFQSSFHLSLAVLVRYRSRARIEPWMESTTRLWAAIPNNPTLGRRSTGGARRALAHGVLTLSDAPFQETRRATAPPRSLPSVYNSHDGRAARFQPWAGSRFTRRY